MTKKRSTKRALLLSALSLLMCVSMLIGSTFAWFTDSVTSKNNIIKSGNLDVKLEYRVQKNGTWTDWDEVDSRTDIFGYDNWEPGCVAIAQFRVTNVGSLALKYQMTADVYEETPGVNVKGEEFLLSDFLYTEVVAADATREQILASTTGKRLKAPVRSDVPNTDLVVSARNLEKDQEEVVALAIWMPTTVGNEANHNGTQPSITFGINLIATQQTFEKDSFNDQYDVNATYPLLAWGSASTTPENNDFVEMDLLRTNGSKAGFVRFHKDSLDTTEENVTVTVIEQQSADNTVTVAADQGAKTYDITVSGLKSGNEKNVTVMLNVGTGYTGMKLYHNNNGTLEEITIDEYKDGVITFKTKSFSPYTIVYDEIIVDVEIEDGEGNEGGEGNEPITEALPKANIKPITEQIEEWTNFGGLLPNDPTQQLDAIFEFTPPHTKETVVDSYFADWYCDFYVTAKSTNLDKLPEISITLGGNYGEFNWVGFGNPEVETNMAIPMLGSMMGGDESINTYWTYERVVNFVEVFKCGVGVSNGSTTNLSDVEVSVELRLTNPENAGESITAG